METKLRQHTTDSMEQKDEQKGAGKSAPRQGLRVEGPRLRPRRRATMMRKEEAGIVVMRS